MPPHFVRSSKKHGEYDAKDSASAKVRHATYLWHHHLYAGAPACLDSHGRPRSKPSDLKGSSGSLRDGRRCGPSALAAGVCDGSCWPRAHCFGTASSPEIFRSRSAPADRGGPAMASAVLERWPPVGATPQSLPQGPGHCVGRPRELAAGQSHAAAPPQARRAAQRRSPAPPARRSQR